MITFDVPNLDAQDEDELDELCYVFRCLGRYAQAKAIASRSRVKGYIDQAVRAESLCDRIYRELPQWARW